jgi:hypothetical protein
MKSFTISPRSSPPSRPRLESQLHVRHRWWMKLGPFLHCIRPVQVTFSSPKHWELQLMTVASFNYIVDLKGGYDHTKIITPHSILLMIMIRRDASYWQSHDHGSISFQALGAKADSPIRPPSTTPFRMEPLANNLIFRLLL